MDGIKAVLRIAYSNQKWKDERKRKRKETKIRKKERKIELRMNDDESNDFFTFYKTAIEI